MPDVRQDHDDMAQLLRAADDVENGARRAELQGVDPHVAQAVSEARARDDKESEERSGRNDAVRAADRRSAGIAEEAAAELDSIESGGRAGVSDPGAATTLSGDVPGTVDPHANIAAARPLPEVMPQESFRGPGYTPTSALNGPMSPSQILGGASPTPPMISPQAYNSQFLTALPGGGMADYAGATQYDTAHALNRDELKEAIYRYLASGEAPEGSDWGSPGSEIVSHPDDPAHAAEIKKMAADYLDLDISYAWGGGHGAEPGLSQGISDGGGNADANGDYNKIGLDCSGFSRDFTYNAYGVDIGSGTAANQYATGMAVSADQARPGDLFFPDSAGRPPGHVTVYLGDGQMIEAQRSGTKLMVTELPSSGEFRRFVE